MVWGRSANNTVAGVQRRGKNPWNSWKGTTERTMTALGVSGQWGDAQMNLGESICLQTWSGKIKDRHQESK